ncbi:MAG TPA: hypothetical protein VGQ59_04640 [Cyclobacteriaceae bacterium]|jgi:hypothetical protein|nr:hypothetical protein [Cyclobacteriaceae bacterium]
MDRFLLMHNPQKDSGEQVFYILQTTTPRVLISVTPIFEKIFELDLETELGKIFRSNFSGSVFSALLKIEIDLQALGNGKQVGRTPELEKTLDRAWRWFQSYKLKALRVDEGNDLPNWMLS